MLGHLCIPGINVIWLRCMILLIHCWIRFANILLRIFPSLFIRDCCCLVAKSSLTLLWPPWTATCQAPLSMGFSGQEYWSWLPFPSPVDLPNPGIKFVSLALAGGFFIIGSPGKPIHQGYWPVTFFSCGVLFWFLRLDNAGLIKWLESVPSCSIFWKSLTRIGINSFQTLWWNSPQSCLVLDFCLLGGLWLPSQSSCQ